MPVGAQVIKSCRLQTMYSEQPGGTAAASIQFRLHLKRLTSNLVKFGVPAAPHGPGGAPFLVAPRVGGSPIACGGASAHSDPTAGSQVPFPPAPPPLLDPPFPRGRPAASAGSPKDPQLRPQAGAPPRFPHGHTLDPATASPLASQSCGLPGLVRLL